MSDSNRLAVAEAARVLRAGDPILAEEACRAILKRDRNQVDALQLLGTIALRRGDDREATRCYRQCIRQSPNEPHFHYLFGKLEAVQGRFDRAVTHYDAALRLAPGYALAVGWRAYALERLGRVDEAMADLAPLVESGEADVTMLDVYSSLLHSAGRSEEAIPGVERALERSDLAGLERKNLLFRLGQLRDRVGRYDDAFEAFASANELLRVPFDPDSFRLAIDDLIAYFTPTRLQAIVRPRTESEKPIFVAGMPRSGTTLVEQVIDAHPDAAGVGEITDLPVLVGNLPVATGSDRPWPACLDDLTQRVVERLARGYLSSLNRLAGPRRRVVNKSLLNYRMLGLVAVLFPAARVVHCRRDPLDTCLSCFFSHLLPETNPFASDLGHLGFVYRQYERLMEHWAAATSLSIHEVVYADMVDRPDETIRNLIDFAGLDWDDRCLRFHESGRAVNTLSYDQVRRPIYRTSRERWRHYESHLGPLRRELERSGKAGPEPGPTPDRP